jgi:hypothetical protein
MLRFSIRDVLFVTLVAGLAVGWWIDHSRLANDRRTALEAQAELQRVVDQHALDRVELDTAIRTAGYTTARFFSGKYARGKVR